MISPKPTPVYSYSKKKKIHLYIVVVSKLTTKELQRQNTANDLFFSIK